ncbi:MAG TPA: hypothetical protein VM901_05645 [Bdellovibrionota bacterium]|nr:hypothetical protein [Bdellovibrionota bacterium]
MQERVFALCLFVLATFASQRVWAIGLPETPQPPVLNCHSLLKRTFGVESIPALSRKSMDLSDVVAKKEMVERMLMLRISLNEPFMRELVVDFLNRSEEDPRAGLRTILTLVRISNETYRETGDYGELEITDSAILWLSDQVFFCPGGCQLSEGVSRDAQSIAHEFVHVLSPQQRLTIYRHWQQNAPRAGDYPEGSLHLLSAILKDLDPTDLANVKASVSMFRNSSIFHFGNNFLLYGPELRELAGQNFYAEQSKLNKGPDRERMWEAVLYNLSAMEDDEPGAARAFIQRNFYRIDEDGNRVFALSPWKIEFDLPWSMARPGDPSWQSPKTVAGNDRRASHPANIVLWEEMLLNASPAMKFESYQIEKYHRIPQIVQLMEAQNARTPPLPKASAPKRSWWRIW